MWSIVTKMRPVGNLSIQDLCAACLLFAHAFFIPSLIHQIIILHSFCAATWGTAELYIKTLQFTQFFSLKIATYFVWVIHTHDCSALSCALWLQGFTRIVNCWQCLMFHASPTASFSVLNMLFHYKSDTFFLLVSKFLIQAHSSIWYLLVPRKNSA